MNCLFHRKQAHGARPKVGTGLVKSWEGVFVKKAPAACWLVATRVVKSAVSRFQRRRIARGKMRFQQQGLSSPWVAIFTDKETPSASRIAVTVLVKSTRGHFQRKKHACDMLIISLVNLWENFVKICIRVVPNYFVRGVLLLSYCALASCGVCY